MADDTKPTNAPAGNAPAAAPPPVTPDAGQSGTPPADPPATPSGTPPTPDPKASGETGNKDSDGLLGQSGQSGGKAKEGEPTGAPDKYELTLPEGSAVDPSHADEIALFAKERGLSNDVAQAILERDAKFVEVAKEAQDTAIKTARGEWVEALKGDKEYGGQKFDQTVELANRALKAFAPDGFVEALGPYVDHDGLIKLLANVGKVMQEDKLVGGSVTPPKTDKSRAQVMFPSMPNP